jgi:hypothetical protein
MVCDYRLDDLGFDPWQNETNFLLASVSRPALEARPVSYPVGTGGPFFGGKARPVLEADHSPSCSAQDKNE